MKKLLHTYDVMIGYIFLGMLSFALMVFPGIALMHLLPQEGVVWALVYESVMLVLIVGGSEWFRFHNRRFARVMHLAADYQRPTELSLCFDNQVSYAVLVLLSLLWLAYAAVCVGIMQFIQPMPISFIFLELAFFFCMAMAMNGPQVWSAFRNQYRVVNGVLYIQEYRMLRRMQPIEIPLDQIDMVKRNIRLEYGLMSRTLILCANGLEKEIAIVDHADDLANYILCKN